MTQYKLGILGGMGPLATVKLVESIVDLTRAVTDQDHIPMLICNNPRLIDRTFAISSGDDAIVQMLLGELRTLEHGCVERIIMPCNTAHYYIDRLQEQTKIPILNMAQLTLDYIKRRHPNQRVVILGTVGTYLGHVYEQFKPQGLDLQIPSEEDRGSLMQIISSIKATGDIGTHAHLLNGQIRTCSDEGSNVVVLACTELSMLHDHITPSPVTIIDAAEILALGAILELDYEVREANTAIDIDCLKECLSVRVKVNAS